MFWIYHMEPHGTREISITHNVDSSVVVTSTPIYFSTTPPPRRGDRAQATGTFRVDEHLDCNGDITYQLAPPPSPVGGPSPSIPPSAPIPGTPAKHTVFISCRLMVMPKLMNPTGHVYLIQANNEMFGGSLADMFGDPGSELKWNNNTGVLEWGYQCDVINDTNVVLLNADLKIRLQYAEALAVENQPNSRKFGRTTADLLADVEIPHLDAGTDRKFTFYIWNCCLDNRFVLIELPKAILAIEVGETSAKTLTVVTPANARLQLSPRVNR